MSDVHAFIHLRGCLKFTVYNQPSNNLEGLKFKIINEIAIHPCNIAEMWLMNILAGYTERFFGFSIKETELFRSHVHDRML